MGRRPSKTLDSATPATGRSVRSSAPLLSSLPQIEDLNLVDLGSRRKPFRLLSVSVKSLPDFIGPNSHTLTRISSVSDIFAKSSDLMHSMASSRSVAISSRRSRSR
jgi:hypothetical protein